MVLGFVLVLTLNQSYDSDRQSVHHSGLPSGENLLQEVSSGVSWKPPALRPSASTTVSKPRSGASGAAPSQQQNVAAMQGPGHPCPTQDSSNGPFLLWVSTPAWPKHSQSCSLGLFLYNLSFPHCSPRPFLLPHFLFPLSLQAIPCINLMLLTLLLLPRKLEIAPLVPGAVPESWQEDGVGDGVTHHRLVRRVPIQVVSGAQLVIGTDGCSTTKNNHHWWAGGPLVERNALARAVVQAFECYGGLPCI